MSFNQSRSDKSDSQYRKSGRPGSFNQQRGSSGVCVKGGGGGPAPFPAITPGALQSSSQSFKRSNNPHGGQSRVNPPPVNSAESNGASTVRTIPNGANTQQSPAAADPPFTNAITKSSEASSVQKSTRVVPKAPAPTPQTTAMNSDPAAPVTPPKVPENSYKRFAFQFGSISPGFMNGNSIPARTSSAPPNLDEQKRDQARHGSSRPVPSVPTPSKQLQAMNYGGVTNQSSSGEAYSVNEVKKEEQASDLPPSSQIQKPSVGMIGISMAKQRQLKAILNKLTPQNFEKLFEQVKAVNIDSAFTLTGVISQIFEKALMEPTLSEMYANLCSHLASELPDFSEDNEKITFRRLLLNKCQEEFERGEREQEEANKDDEDEVKQSDEEREEERVKARRRMLGNIRLIGELYKKRMLTERIMHECIKKLLGSYQDPDEEDIEALCELMRTIGEVIDHSEAKEHMDAYFERMTLLSNNMNLSSRVRFMLKDAIYLRKNKWQQKRKSGSYGGGILSGPMQSMGNQGVMHRNSHDDEKWQRATNFQQRGLIPSPQTPLQIMDKPETMYEISKVTDEEQAKQRQLKAILNKLTPQNFEKLFEQVKAVNIDSAFTLTGVISQIFEKALMEPTLSEMYANLCSHLASELPDFSEDNEKITFRRLLLNKCQEEFERGEREQEEANKDDEDEVKQSDEEREEERVKARRRMLGNIRLIGELYKKRMLTDRIMHECIKKLLGSYQDPDEEDIEALCELMRTIGEVIDHSEAKEHMDAYFERMTLLSNNMNLSSRVRFMLKDAIYLRKNKWQQKRKSGSYGGGILSGPMQSMGNQGVMHRNSHDDEKWQRATNFQQRGLIPSPQTPLQIMDKPETMYEISKVTDEEQAKQRQLKAILNKLTPQNFEKLFEQVKAVNIDSAFTLTGVISQIFEKALMEPTLSEMYANLCSHLASELPDFSEDNEKITFRRLLLNKCQEEFERGEREQEEANKDDEDEVKQSDEEREEERVKARRRMLGNIRLIGELYKKRMLTERIMHECIKMLLGSYQDPDEEDIEALCELMRTIGEVIDYSKAKEHMDAYFERMTLLSNNMNLSSRVRFMLKDAIYLRKNKWQQKRKSGSYGGGILSGPMQSMGNQGVMHRNSHDDEKWQRATNFQQRGLIPSPQTPLQIMDKPETMYEISKVTDEEQAKQRQLKAILNKLTPQNFEKLFEQVKAVNIDSAFTLTGVISQIFEKALMEPTLSEMYANLCSHLASELPDFSYDNEKITFRRLLLNKCQEEFERGEREQEEANKDDEDEVKQSDEEREEKRVKARRRMLGNIRLIGELYKKRMLTERIMHECIKKLLGSYQDPDEEDIEALCELMRTIGEVIDHSKAKEHMDAYFERMTLLSNNMNLSSQVRFMLRDAIDLRKNKWQRKRKGEDPKKIEEVHRDTAQERPNWDARTWSRQCQRTFGQKNGCGTFPWQQLKNTSSIIFFFLHVLSFVAVVCLIGPFFIGYFLDI